MQFKDHPLEYWCTIICFYEILGFIEDRKKTLIDIKRNPETSHIPCFLADWGYLKGSDRYTLSNEIKLLKLGNLEELVAI